MALIGELLVQEGLVTRDDVEAGLEHGRQRRMRLASALVAMGKLTIDQASRALAAQHGVPAALERHLASRDVALSSLIGPQLAWAMGALPLAISRGNDALVVCLRDPFPTAVHALERAAGRPIVLAVAVDVALLPLIAETYPVTRPSDPAIPVEVDVELDSGAVSVSHLDADTLELVDLDHQAVTRDPTQQYKPGNSIPGFQAIGPALAPAPAAGRGMALDPALVAIHAAETAAEVVEATVAYLRHRFAYGLVFIVKDGLALGQAGHGDRLADDAISALVLPLSQPSVLRIAHDNQATFVGPPGDGASVVQERFFRLFGSAPLQVLVVPVVVRRRVVKLIYAHGPRQRGVEDAAAELGTLADAASEALVRIIRESKID